MNKDFILENKDALIENFKEETKHLLPFAVFPFRALVKREIYKIKKNILQTLLIDAGLNPEEIILLMEDEEVMELLNG